MIWWLFQKVGFWIFVSLTIYFVYKKKHEKLLALYFWGLTFATCYQYVFTIWLPVKIIAMGMVLCLIFSGIKRYSLASKFIYPFVALFFVTIIISDIVGVCFTGDYALQINKYIRMFNSNYTYLTTAALLFVGNIMERGFVKRVFPAYCLAVEIAIAIGLIHFICLKMGIPFMPILRQDGSVNEVAGAMMGENVVYRIYGFAGEPKNLGFLICPYLLASLVMYGQNAYRINKHYHILAFLAGCFALLNTYSSSALINFFLAVPLIMFLLPFPKITYRAASIVGVLCVAACIWFLVDETNPYRKETGESSYFTQLYDRTFGRAQNELENDRQESVVFEYFVNDDNIIHNLFGWGVSQYTFYAPGQASGGVLIPMQSGLMLTLADFGFAGFVVLISSLCYVLLRILKLSLRSQNVYAQAFSVAALSAFIGSLMYGNITNCFIYLMLAIYAYYDDEEEQLANRCIV